jgi:hypothetical protein
MIVLLSPSKTQDWKSSLDHWVFTRREAGADRSRP